MPSARFIAREKQKEGPRLPMERHRMSMYLPKSDKPGLQSAKCTAHRNMAHTSETDEECRKDDEDETQERGAYYRN
jgi:hypothetical protein